MPTLNQKQPNALWQHRAGMQLYWTTKSAGTDIMPRTFSDFDLVPSITILETARTIDVTFWSGWDGGNVQIDGLSPQGRSVSVVVAGTPVSTVETDQPFSIITNVKNLGTRLGGSVTIEVGPRLGLPFRRTEVYKESSFSDATEYTVNATDANYGTYTPSIAMGFPMQLWYRPAQGFGL